MNVELIQNLWIHAPVLNANTFVQNLQTAELYPHIKGEFQTTAQRFVNYFEEATL